MSSQPVSHLTPFSPLLRVGHAQDMDWVVTRLLVWLRTFVLH